MKSNVKRLVCVITFISIGFLYAFADEPDSSGLIVPGTDSRPAAAVPLRVRKAVMNQLNIDPRRGGEIIDIAAFCHEYPGGAEYWSVSVSFRLYQGGPVMSVETNVQTSKWDG